jgi:hypothetical protein
MKFKQIFSITCILLLTYNAFCCNIFYVLPYYVNPGDSVNLAIIGDFTDCDLINNMIICSYGDMDTIYAEEYTIIDDSLIEALFIFPDTVTLGDGTIIISSNEYGWVYSDPGRIKIMSEIAIAPEICMVTVDSSNKNMIIWEELHMITIDSIYIYKETSVSGKYEKIGANHYTDLTCFIDMASIPEQNASSYKISLIDKNGQESPLSNRHKTIHLTMSIGVGGVCNLNWDRYSGFYYSTFNVYRGNSLNNLEKIAELPTSLLSYTDLDPPPGNLYYVIGITKTPGCNIGNLKSTAEYYTSAHSNFTYLETSKLKDNFTDEYINVFPDAANNVLNVMLKDKSGEYNISILSLDGKEEFKLKVFNDTQIDISNLQPGIYFIKIDSNKIQAVQKFIKN